MQPKIENDGYGQDGERYLIARPLLSHYRHVKAGRKHLAKCNVCSQGMDAITAPVADLLPEPELVPDSGVDESGTTPSPSDRWWNGDAVGGV